MLGEFDRKVLEVLREPMESGFIVIARARDRMRFPARFQLVAAMNPCPCTCNIPGMNVHSSLGGSWTHDRTITLGNPRTYQSHAIHPSDRRAGGQKGIQVKTSSTSIPSNYLVG